MPRDRDSDYDRDDDRPRRRRSDDPPRKSGGTGTVLLVVGLAVGIPLLLCGGVVVYIVSVVGQVAASVKQGVEQFAGSVQATQEANEFLALLQTAPDAAYRRTTADFRKGTSQAQFDKLLADNPVLTVQSYHSSNQLPTPVGTAPNRTVSFTTTVIAGVNPNPDPDQPTPTGPRTVTAPKPPPMTPTTAPKPKSVTVVIGLAEQPDGTWKVDKFNVQ